MYGLSAVKVGSTVLSSRELILYIGLYSASHSHVNSRGTGPEQPVECAPIAPKWSNEFYFLLLAGYVPNVAKRSI